MATTAATAGCSNDDGLVVPDTMTQMTVTVHQTVPHDTEAFTQGLELLDDGTLIESAGGHDRSTLRRTRPGQAEPDLSVPAPEGRFAEGVTVVGDRAIQLTWKDKVAHVWDLNTFDLVEELPYDTQGWGICHAETLDVLYTTDGSDQLVTRDPATLARSATVTVTLAGDPVEDLNELECVDGHVWANVWHSDKILRIDPATGHVDTIVNAAPLVTAAEEANGKPFTADQVLNGIAHDPATDQWWVTGKEWPVMFKVTFTG